MSDNATEEEKINYAIKTFDSGIRTYWMNRYIRLDKAVELLDKAQKLWAEKPIENPIHEAKLSEDVKNYLDEELVNTGNNAQVVSLGKMQNSNGQVVNTGIFDNAKGEYTFTVKGNKFTISLSGKSFGLKWSKDSDKKNNQYRDTKTTKSVSVTCDYIRLDKDIDISWGKIKSALLKIDYKTTIQGGVKVTTNNKVGQQDADGSEVTSSLSSVISGYKQALSNITKGVNESKYTNDSVYICRIKVVPAGFAAVDFIVKGVVTVTGELKAESSLDTMITVHYTSSL